MRRQFSNIDPRWLTRAEVEKQIRTCVFSAVNDEWSFWFKNHFDAKALTIPPCEYTCKSEIKKNSRFRSKRSGACCLIRLSAKNLTITCISLKLNLSLLFFYIRFTIKFRFIIQTNRCCMAVVSSYRKGLG